MKLHLMLNVVSHEMRFEKHRSKCLVNSHSKYSCHYFAFSCDLYKQVKAIDTSMNV